MVKLVEQREPERRRRRRTDPGPDVLSAAAGGDRGAQQELLLGCMNRMRRRVGRLVGASSEADDLVQQACVELLRSLPRFRGDASFALWVDRITTHVVYKHFRTQKRRRARLALVEDVDRKSPLDADRALDARLGVEAARRVIDRLKPERRIVFLLVAVEGRTLPETAAMLDLSLPAAKSRYLRARRDVDRWVAKDPRLCALLEREGGTDG
jgi:RNA polymerase sigma-70 factor (ECF subfamily)